MPSKKALTLEVAAAILVLAMLVSWGYFSSLNRKQGIDLDISKAVVTTRMNITNCIAVPTVASMKEGSRATFVNRDGASHSLVVSGTKYIVPSNGSRTFSLSISKTPGLHPFDCDSNGSVGAIYITQ